MRRRLDFLVIGAQKCATSWLFYCLKDHDGLFLPKKKNEDHYLGGDLYLARGPDWYFSLFEGAAEEQRVGAVSIEYLFDPRSPEVILRFAPTVKLIASIRNPIDRAISAYYWNVRRGFVDSVPVNEGIGRAIEHYERMVNGGSRTVYTDIIARGLYDAQIERYLQFFDKNQFLIILFEDIRSDPIRAVSRIYEFIGVEKGYTPRSLNIRPKENTYVATVIKMERLLRGIKGTGKLMDIVNRLTNRLGLAAERPELSRELSDRLRELYRPHVGRLRGILEDMGARSRIPEFSERGGWINNW